VPEGRRGQLQVLLRVVRLHLAGQRGNLPAVAEQAQRLQALAEAPEAAQPGLGDELRALALIVLGDTEIWAARLDQAEPVPLEYSIEWLTCASASGLDVMMVSLPGAAQDRLLAHMPGTRLGCPGVPR